MPLIYEACQADQFAYEYEHGVTSYGAFTYTLSRVLRQHRLRTRSITFTQLLNEARTTLHDLNSRLSLMRLQERLSRAVENPRHGNVMALSLVGCQLTKFC